jgi:ABC-2 type transport system ATP-binding protein
MIEARDLTKNYGPIRALQGVNFTIAAGEVVGLTGNNGAGKSTAMRITTGFLAPTSGSMLVAGTEVLDDPKGAQALMGYLPEGNPLYLDMRLREALKFTASVRGLAGAERKQAIGAALDDAGLLGREHQVISSLSRGFRQRVGLAMALLHRPPILILDEPTSGLDPTQQTEMRKLIRSLAEEHTVIFSSHILSEVEAVCDRVITIHEGRVVADGTVDEVRQHKDAAGKLIAVTVAGSADAARTVFGGLGFGEIVTCVPDIKDSAYTHVQLRTGDENDVSARVAVSRAAYEADLGLVSLTLERASLEDAFAALTIHDPSDDPIGREVEPMSTPPGGVADDPFDGDASTPETKGDADVS